MAVRARCQPIDSVQSPTESSPAQPESLFWPPQSIGSSSHARSASFLRPCPSQAQIQTGSKKKKENENGRETPKTANRVKRFAVAFPSPTVWLSLVLAVTARLPWPFPITLGTLFFPLSYSSHDSSHPRPWPQSHITLHKIAVPQSRLLCDGLGTQSCQAQSMSVIYFAYYSTTRVVMESSMLEPANYFPLTAFRMVLRAE